MRKLILTLNQNGYKCNVEANVFGTVKKLSHFENNEEYFKLCTATEYVSDSRFHVLTTREIIEMAIEESKKALANKYDYQSVTDKCDRFYRIFGLTAEINSENKYYDILECIPYSEKALKYNVEQAAEIILNSPQLTMEEIGVVEELTEQIKSNLRCRKMFNCVLVNDKQEERIIIDELDNMQEYLSEIAEIVRE